LVAAAELLIGHRFWLGRVDFVEQFVRMDLDADGVRAAFVDWEAVAAAAQAGRLVCSGSQGHVLAIAASLAVGVPVDLGAAVGGLDERNLALVATAIWTAGGHARGSVSW